MVEGLMFWNEPNNKSHWAFELDPEWRTFGEMVKLAAKAVAAENRRPWRVLGGISPIDPNFIRNMQQQGVLDELDVVAVHGFPLDWNHWTIDQWPAKLEEIRALTRMPVWVSEVGVSSFGAEEVQEFGVQRTAALLAGRADRIHWYSLYDLPRAWPATTRHREAEGSAYYRHFYMGLLREDGTPKRALKVFSRHTPHLGICQWFHFEDHRLESAAQWLRELGVKHLRTGLSWADSFRPNAEAWFDRQMKVLEEFDVTLTFCFTPEHCGIEPHHTSPPRQIEQYAEFCAAMTRRYVNNQPGAEPILASSSLNRWREPASPEPLTHLRPLGPPDDSLVPAPDTLIIVAHPDDEVIGAGAHLPRLGNMMVIHVTDGAPRDMDDALQAGFSTRADYAAARRHELENVLELVGIQPSRASCLGIVDREASLHLVEITRRLAAMIVVLRPAIVLTHAYEGGHPDHDATAFAVHAASRLLKSAGIEPPVIIEITCYHGSEGGRGMVCSEFLPVDGRTYVTRELDEAQRALKQKLLSCYTTQQNVLRAFPVNDEKFRVAPDYDFTAPPHGGSLYYESHPWGMTAERWCILAEQAFQELNMHSSSSPANPGRPVQEPSPVSDSRRSISPCLP